MTPPHRWLGLPFVPGFAGFVEKIAPYADPDDHDEEKDLFEPVD